MGKGARAVLVILETIMYRQELCVFCVIGVEDRFFREIIGLIIPQGHRYTRVLDAVLGIHGSSS
jgi:hypothetical protein